MQQPPSKPDEILSTGNASLDQILEGGIPAGQLMTLVGGVPPRPAEHKTNLVEDVVFRSIEAGVPVEVNMEGTKLSLNMESTAQQLGVSPAMLEKIAAIESAEGASQDPMDILGKSGVMIIDEANMPRDVSLPTVKVEPGVLEYVAPVYEVEGYYIKESGVIPVYGKDPMVVRKHPTENWSVHWPYQGQMSWIPFTRLPKGILVMLEVHLRDTELYPREAHARAERILREPHAVQQEMRPPAPPPKPLTWTQKRKLAEGKPLKRRRVNAARPRPFGR